MIKNPTLSNDINNPLSDQEQEKFAGIESSISKKFMTLADIVIEMREIEKLNLFRHTHKTFAAYCSDKWGMKEDQMDVIEQTRSIMADVKPELSAFSLSNRDVIDEFVNLDKYQRVLLARQVASKIKDEKLTGDFIHKIKEEMFPERCLSI